MISTFRIIRVNIFTKTKLRLQGNATEEKHENAL